MRRHSWAWMFTAVLIATAGSGITPAGAAAPDDWRALQSEIAAAYPPIATEDGRFRDYVHPSRPGPRAIPSLGLSLVQAGLRTGDHAQLEAGLRTMNWFTEHVDQNGAGVFDHYALATTYNIMREQLPDHPLFTAHRAAWARRLRTIPLLWLANTKHYANKYMVEVVAVLESVRSGLKSNVRGSVLAHPAHAERLARELLDRVAPEIARRASTAVAGAPALVLSDPSNSALAYHGLTLGFLGRAIELLGPTASARSREALQRVARASWALTAPDGMLAYVGRSQEQAWALAMTAYGAEVAAADADATWAPRFHAVADRAIARLRAVHGVGPHGLWITPSRDAVGRSARGVDSYAGGPNYGGLALVGLNWAVDHAERHDRSVSELAADAPGSWQLSTGKAAFHTVRRPSSWYAVKRSRSYYASDLRYDFGLIALKVPSTDGGWFDVVRVRPHTVGRGDSAGPVLIAKGARALPDGTSSRVGETGVVTIRGGYKVDHRWVSRGETFRFVPIACGIEATFTRRRGGELVYSVFFPQRPTVANGQVAGGGIVVRTRTPAIVRLRSGYSSAIDGRLVRADLHFPAGRSPVSVTICGGQA